jgi:ribosomal protein S18 acetylase RimI-like enzyme
MLPYILISKGKDWGEKLMAFAEHEARRLELATITLYTNERMTENIEIYKRLGYIETERKIEQRYQRIYKCKSLLDVAT